MSAHMSASRVDTPDGFSVLGHVEHEGRTFTAGGGHVSDSHAYVYPTAPAVRWYVMGLPWYVPDDKRATVDTEADAARVLAWFLETYPADTDAARYLKVSRAPFLTSGYRIGTWDGEIPGARVLKRTQYRQWNPFSGFHEVRVCWRFRLADGREYAGRNSGEGMLLKARRVQVPARKVSA